MGHQGQEGWYPECELCSCGNLSKVVCDTCYNELVKKVWKLEKSLKRLKQKIKEANK